MGMKRNLFHLGIALLTFCFGLGTQEAFEKPLELSSPNLIDLKVPDQSLEPKPQLRPGSLPAELQSIDQKYGQRCQLPTDWKGQHPTVIQLETFRVCNDEWARSRREAITAEMRNYLVQY